MKKILILSQASLESSTDYLCKWLLYYEIPFLRYNGEDLFTKNSLNELPNDADFGIAWYRRRISKFPFLKTSFRKEDHNAEEKILKFLNNEIKALHSYLFYKIDLKKWVNNPFNLVALNKLQILALADKYELKIPGTEMVTTKGAVETLLKKYDQLIVKPFSETIFFDDSDGNHYNMLTKAINLKNLNLVPDRFSPSLVQEDIAKKMELRSFYLYGQFYTMAICSQNNKQTKVDFRNYDAIKPNRTIPYKLPNYVEEKLRKLMGHLSFQTGSIDLILTPTGEYVFLEINPEGQFGMVSYPCNYYLEKEMALHFKAIIKDEN